MRSTAVQAGIDASASQVVASLREDIGAWDHL